MADPATWIDEVSADQAMTHTREIAQWVRLSGSEDERKAFDYIRGVLDGYGLTDKHIWIDETNASPNLDPQWTVERPAWQITLEQQGLKEGTDFVVTPWADLGFPSYANLFFADRSYVEANRDTVVRFMRASTTVAAGKA